MTLGSFIMANKLGIAVVAAGGTVAAIGVVIYANVQDNRKSDRLHYDEQLNAIRFDVFIILFYSVRSFLRPVSFVGLSNSLMETTVVNRIKSERLVSHVIK